MPSLEEWDKYLREQEEALLKSLEQESDGPECVSQIAMADGACTEPVAPTETSAEPDYSPKAGLTRVVKLRRSLPEQIMAPNEHESEIVQNSYQEFKESREELLQRLLDPQISLEDAARILNVCPTTIRRYTNKGLLKHLRTAGNQRRFRLSDVLALMESQSSIQDPSEHNES